MHRLDQGAGAELADLLALLRGLAANIGLDRIQCTDPLQGFMGKRRVRCDVNVVELPPRMCPAKRQCRSVVRRAGDQAAKPGVTIDLKQTAETFQMGCRMLALTIFTVGIRGRRMTGS